MSSTDVTGQSSPTTPGRQAPFVQRLIDVTFTLAQGTFGIENNNTNQIKLSGLRISARIANWGGYATGILDMDIYGMPFGLMNRLSTLGVTIQNDVTKLLSNVVTVTAGNNIQGMGIVFQGTILSAWSDFEPAPEVPFRVHAQVMAAQGVIAYPPSSFNGPTDVATIFSGLAAAMNLRFENNGVSATIPKPYLWGSAKDQLIQAITQAGVSCNMGENGVLAIWPKKGNRSGQVPLISPSTGMIGYPSYSSVGIIVRSIFNPSVGLGESGNTMGASSTGSGGGPLLGGLIQIQSSLPQANGTYKVYGLDHVLESQVPHGQWFTTIKAYNPKTQSQPL